MKNYANAIILSFFFIFCCSSLHSLLEIVQTLEMASANGSQSQFQRITRNSENPISIIKFEPCEHWWIWFVHNLILSRSLKCNWNSFELWHQNTFIHFDLLYMCIVCIVHCVYMMCDGMQHTETTNHPL